MNEGSKYKQRGRVGAGKFGSSAAVGQVLPPKPQMLGKQDWRYVSGGGQYVHGAHAAESDITSLAFLRDSNTMLSRGADATLKVRALTLCEPLFARSVSAPVLAFTLGGSKLGMSYHAPHHPGLAGGFERL